MARPRKNDPTAILRPIIEQFAMQVASTIERFTVERITQAIHSQRDGASSKNGKALAPRATRTRRKRAPVLCYYTGCKNVAAPRFSMFCAAEHKNLPKAEKDKYIKQHKERA